MNITETKGKDYMADILLFYAPIVFEWDGIKKPRDKHNYTYLRRPFPKTRIGYSTCNY